MTPNEADYFRAVGFYEASGMTHDAAHAAAESEMESRERMHDDESRRLQSLQQ